MHKAVDKCAQAPACNAVKIGGEKMTTRLRRTFFVCGSMRSRQDRQSGRAGIAVVPGRHRATPRHVVNLAITSVVPTS
ncbi:hypothetical protein XANMN_14960 [Xanthomonas phaseoli pv. manihotis str. CIO151]|nr:hypothetical protein XANMN_14960 [Xanthomonas phaseoli pv. manihotis str. CIO151]